MPNTKAMPFARCIIGCTLATEEELKDLCPRRARDLAFDVHVDEGQGALSIGAYAGQR